MSLLLTTKRRIVQAASVVLLNSKFLVVNSESFCLPVMNCEACALAWLGCPIGMMGSSIGFHEVPWMVFVFVGAAGLILGRFLCGWVCPMGFLQDLLYKIPWVKFKIPKFLTWLKYGFLLITVALVAYVWGKKSGLFYCSFCPTSTLQVVIPSMIAGTQSPFGGGAAVRFLTLGAVLFLAMANHRSFCKVMCPIGALVALTNKFSLFSLKLNADKCIQCSKCDKDCPMDIPVMTSQEKGRSINRNEECVGCLACEETCPEAAISNNSRILKQPPAS